MTEFKKWININSFHLITGTLLTAIILLATFLRFFQIGKLSFWNDELETITFTSRSLQGLLGTIQQKEPNMSLYYLIIHYWMQFFPNASDGLLRIPSAIFSILSIPVVFLLGKEFGSNKKQSIFIGLTAALLITLNAFHIQYAQDLRAYSLVFLLATLSTYLFIRAVERPNSYYIWWTAYIFVSAAAIYSHFFVIFLLIAQALSLLVLYSKRNIYLITGFIVSVVSIGALVFPILFLGILSPEQIGWIPATNITFFKNLLFEITGSWGEFLTGVYVYAVVAGFVVETAKIRKTKNILQKWKLTLVTNCFLFPIIIMTLISVVKPILVDHFLIYILPYSCILIGIGLESIVSSEWTFFKSTGVAVLTIIVILSGLGALNYFQTFQKEDWRGVSKYMTINCSAPDDLRLYYVTWIKTNPLYYNANLTAQSDVVESALNHKDLNKLTQLIPVNYKKICLVLGQNWQPSDLAQTKNIKSALQNGFIHTTSAQYYELGIDVYTR